MTHWSKPDRSRYAPEGSSSDGHGMVHPAGADGPGLWVCTVCGQAFRNNLQATIHVEQGRPGPRHLLAWWSSERKQLETVDKG